MTDPVTCEKDKMRRGDLYHALDPQLCAERLQARQWLKAFNDTPPELADARQRILRQLIPHAASGLWIEPPFQCDYGHQINVGENIFLNFNCVILDVMQVTIGSRVLFGPGVHVYTATHPLDYKMRAAGLESGRPVTIGDDVWIGGGAVICPGVTIGDRSVIGADSVVTRSIPSDVMAAGNPCRVVRDLK